MAFAPTQTPSARRLADLCPSPICTHDRSQRNATIHAQPLKRDVLPSLVSTQGEIERRCKAMLAPIVIAPPSSP